MATAEEALRNETLESLTRIQKFDAATLVREQDLGAKKNFAGAVVPAKRMIELYQRLTPSALQDFPSDVLTSVKQRANSDYNLFEQVLKFDPDQSTAARDQLIQNITAQYQEAFRLLHPYIAYSLHRAADFQRLDSDARGALQSIRDQSERIIGQMQSKQQEIEGIVEGVRRAAAEVGVTQEAKYFKGAADDHQAEALKWRKRTYQFTTALGVYAVLTLFIHKWPFLTPTTAYEAVQLGISKVLIFAVLSFLLYLAARNFLSHEHNSIINRHRQNALLTYKTLADAATDSPNRDVILAHAAACIYSPQPTGYSGDTGVSTPGVKSVIEMLTRPSSVAH